MTTSLELLWRVRDLRDARLRPPHKAALFALAAFKRDADGPIVASLGQLAVASAMHRATVVRAVHELREWGYVSTPDRRPGDRTPQSFTVTANWSQSATSRTARPVAECDHPSRTARPVLVAESDVTGRTARPSEDLSEEREDLSEDPLSTSPSGTLDESEPEAGKGETQKPEKPKKPTRAAETREVFEHFLAERAKHVTGGVQPKLKPQERKRASILFNADYDVDQLKLACEGLFVDKFCVENGHTRFFHVVSEKMVDRLIEAGQRARAEREEAEARMAEASRRQVERAQQPAMSPEQHREFLNMLTQSYRSKWSLDDEGSP